MDEENIDKSSNTLIYVGLGIIGLVAFLALILGIVLPFIIKGPTGETGAPGKTGATGPAVFDALAMNINAPQFTNLTLQPGGKTWTINNIAVLQFNNYISGNKNLQNANYYFIPSYAGTWMLNYIIACSIQVSSAGNLELYVCLIKSNNTILNINVTTYSEIVGSSVEVINLTGFFPIDVTNDDISGGYGYNIGVYASGSTNSGVPIIVNYSPSSVTGAPITTYPTSIIFQSLREYSS